MLVVFNLGWERFNIDRQVSAANRKMKDLAHDKKAGHFIIFNLSSLGAGERLIDREARIKEASRKDPSFEEKVKQMSVVPTDGDQKDDHPLTAPKPAGRTIDYLRRRHWRIARDLGNDSNFKAYRDAAEMLASLSSRGHRLAAVFTGASARAEQDLKKARALDYFEDRVYGYDSLQSRKDDLTSRGVYLHAMKMNRTPPADSIIVADTPEGIEEGSYLKPMAVAGYLDPYLENSAIDAKLAEMQQAGAAYAVVGGHSISSLPDYLLGQRRLKSTMQVIQRKFDS